MKRLYQTVEVAKNDEGFIFLADGKTLRTRAGKVLIAPNREIAEQVVKEWESQKKEVIIETMPITHMLNTKIDRIMAGRKAIEAGLLRYIDTDLVCYFAPGPEDLVSLQKQRWDPFRLWFSEFFSCDLKTTNTLKAEPQTEKAHQKVREHINGMNDDLLTVLQWVTVLGGSLVMALGFIQQKFGVEGIMQSRFVEEDYKIGLLKIANPSEDFSLDESRDSTRRDLEASSKYLRTLL